MSFEFIREGRVWLEYPSNTFTLLHTQRDIQFSQTFKQNTTSRNTLHNPDQFFKRSNITEANPANFSFTAFVLKEPSKLQHKVLDLLLYYSVSPTYTLDTFNLYFVYENYSPQVYYKLEKCVFTSGSFNIPRNGIMTLGLSGEARKLTRNVSPWNVSEHVGYTNSPTFAVSKAFDVYVGGLTSQYKLDNVIGASFEAQNSITWTSNKTLQDSLSVTDETNTIFPNNFTLEDRSFAGNIRQYIDQTNTMSRNNVLTWSEGTTVQIKAGLASNDYQIQISLEDNASFTNRPSVGEVFSQSYDYRLIGNPLMNNVFTY